MLRYREREKKKRNNTSFVFRYSEGVAWVAWGYKGIEGGMETGTAGKHQKCKELRKNVLFIIIIKSWEGEREGSLYTKDFFFLRLYFILSCTKVSLRNNETGGNSMLHCGECWMKLLEREKNRN